MLQPPRSRRTRIPLATAAVALAALCLTACDADSGSETSARDGKDTGPSVLAPGRPGEPARTLSPSEAAKALPDDSPNAADYSYVHMMITHHEQALEMTRLVPDRAESDKVRRLSERISAAQKPEVDAMRGWLAAHPQKGGGGHGHDHALMPGMATEAQLKQLRAAKGAAFDELFLKLMITHHQGAVTMAGDVLGQGNNVLVEEMANDVIAQQTSEIGRMRDM